MYCPSCGSESHTDAKFCTECGNELPHESSVSTNEQERSRESGPAPEEYDLAMSIQDGLERTKLARLVIDLGIIVVSVGLWIGIMVAEYLVHHSKLKKGEREPFDENDSQVWHLF